MGPKQLPDDFKDFIQCLNRHNVRYLLLGGWAVGLYGTPRATKDMDFFIAVDDTNLRRLQAALREFGAPTVADEVLRGTGNVFRMGRSPIQIDIINRASGIMFDECYPNRNMVRVADVDISVISRQDLIKNKRSSGRTRDLGDAEALDKK